MNTPARTAPATPADLPLTGQPASGLWSQREYVAAMQQGIGFAAHNYGLSSWFHYRLPERDGAAPRCVSLQVDASGVRQRINHAFPPELHWPQQCRLAVIGRSL